MQNEEQQLIESLFSRLKQAESQSGPRDAGAEQLIKQHLQNQPGAPYYMSQAILIQEAALKSSMHRSRIWKIVWRRRSSNSRHSRAAAVFFQACLAAVRVRQPPSSNNRPGARHRRSLSSSMRPRHSSNTVQRRRAAPASSAAHCKRQLAWRVAW